MRVMVLVKANAASEANNMSTEDMTEMFAQMGAYNEQLIAAGIMLTGEGLTPSSQGKRIVFDGPSRTVIDGPFAEVRELVAGFWMWEVKDMAEAVEWAKRCPNPMPGESELELRPVGEIEDFGDAVTPEILAHDQKLRDQLAKR